MRIRKFHILMADMLFGAHCVVGIFILTGWLFSKIKIEYLVFLASWLSCWIFLGYCPITKWEFTLRRKYNKDINPNDEAIQYYVYKFLKKRISAKSVFAGGVIVFILLVILALTTHVY